MASVFRSESWQGFLRLIDGGQRVLKRVALLSVVAVFIFYFFSNLTETPQYEIKRARLFFVSFVMPCRFVVVSKYKYLEPLIYTLATFSMAGLLLGCLCRVDS